MPIWLWISFFVLILFLVFLDLRGLHRKKKIMKLSEALLWSLFWITLALIFNLLVFYIYEHHVIAISPAYEKTGAEAALQFFTGYLVEKTLSLDNIFVISLIFTYYKIAPAYQHKVLMWGILTAAFLRGILIFLGIALVQNFSWILYVFGAFLAYTGIKLLKNGEDSSSFSQDNWTSRLIHAFIPISSNVSTQKFFIKENAIWKITPLFLALIQIEISDVIFALDSIPAIFAITLDPFIVYTSNIFAIFGLRALYFTLTPLVHRFRYIKSSLALILVYIGIKMIVSHFYKIPHIFSLLIILGLLGGAVILSIFLPEGAELPQNDKGGDKSPPLK